MTARRGTFLASVFSLLAIAVAGAADNPQPAGRGADSPTALPFVPIATNLVKPVGLVNAGDGSGRLFIVLQDGKIMIWNGTQVLATPFLDIDAIVNSSGSEQGLLGLAFHPDYATNGFFYVNYTDNTGADTVVARYSVSAVNPNVANPASALKLVEIDQPFSNHNGGELQFGPDGYLYIGMGDGGSGGDPFDNGQNPAVLLAKMLRIDVDGGGNPPDCGGSTANYTIPADNPFVDGPGGACDEIWHMGLRNPWRFTFDRLTGDMFIGDVGQDAWEEVDRQPAGEGGKNWGWRCYEGNHPYNTTGCGPIGDYDAPILEYPHSLGCSITGGYVYRGPIMPGLGQGTYVFADFCSGRIWGARPQAGKWRKLQLADTPYNITTFGETETGQICFTHDDTSSSPTGTVFCIQPAN